MGRATFTRAAYTESRKEHDSGPGPSTKRAEQKAHETGLLDPLVDPSGYGVIRPSRPRFEEQPNGMWLMTIGVPVPVETRVDTTGSMGHNIDVALEVLPNAFELISGMLTGCDLQIATGSFGDVRDRFVLCRPQFEALAERIVPQLTLMVPERGGFDFEEDPQYGIFGAAYLTAFYINRLGLKGYDFTVTDASARDHLDPRTLKRVFGDEVFAKVREAGHKINEHDLPSTSDVVSDLLKRAHAFVLMVGGEAETKRFWTRIYGANRVIALPNTKLLPQVQAVIIGLTEGTLELSNVEQFLQTHNVEPEDAQRILKSVANIPIGAQAALPNFDKRPKAGDLFRVKTDLWPLTPEELKELNLDSTTPASDEKGDNPTWSL